MPDIQSRYIGELTILLKMPYDALPLYAVGLRGIEICILVFLYRVTEVPCGNIQL